MIISLSFNIFPSDKPLCPISRLKRSPLKLRTSGAGKIYLIVIKNSTIRRSTSLSNSLSFTLCKFWIIVSKIQPQSFQVPFFTSVICIIFCSIGQAILMSKQINKSLVKKTSRYNYENYLNFFMSSLEPRTPSISDLSPHFTSITIFTHVFYIFKL